MARKKVVFVAFAMEDERQRDFLRGQSLNTASPFEFIDMSVKEAYDKDWKDKVRTRIRRSDGVIALISDSSATSSGQKWEIGCAQDEDIPILGVWAYRTERSRPTSMKGEKIIPWTWAGISDFIDSL
jgi:nucleoside 2-deoxyribosyltransferase